MNVFAYVEITCGKNCCNEISGMNEVDEGSSPLAEINCSLRGWGPSHRAVTGQGEHRQLHSAWRMLLPWIQYMLRVWKAEQEEKSIGSGADTEP